MLFVRWEMRSKRARAWGWILTAALILAACDLPPRGGLPVQEPTLAPGVEQAEPGEESAGSAEGTELLPTPPQEDLTPESEAHLPVIQGGAEPQETAASPLGSQIFIPQVSKAGTDSPSVTLQASASQLRVGETLTVTVQVAHIGLPYYYLHVQSPDMTEPVQIARVTYDNQVTAFNNPAAQVTFTGGRGGMSQADFMLMAAQPGDLQLSVTVTGEIQLPTGGTWSGAGGGPVQIQVIQ